jgi:glycosyltransferase involved in cell wall biosynthesis
VGVISRWLHLKGLQYIIPAFKTLLYDYSNAFLILANANGPYKPEVEKLLAGLPDNSYMTIPFENDLFTLYQLFDVYVHTPINPTVEAFGQTYVEALAAGIPSVFTMSGVAPEFVEHERNAWVVDFKDINATHKSILRLLTDKGLSERLKKNGRRDIQRFELGHMISKLEKLYESQVRR